MGNMAFALNLLLAGIVIVFFVLILLILIIKIMGVTIQSFQNRTKQKNGATKPAKDEEKIESAPVAAVQSAPPSDGEIPGEVIVVIAAAVNSVYGDKPVKIKSVKRSRNSGSAWRNAGLLENTKPF